MKAKAFSRGERKAQIQAAFAVQIQQGLGNVMTVYGLAKKLNMAPSSHLQKIVKEMEEEGVLKSTYVVHRQGWKRLYSMQSVEFPARTIRVNGIVMEMKS